MSDPPGRVELTIEDHRTRSRPAGPPPTEAPTMCLPGQPPAPPATAGEALSAISAGLQYLTAADAASPTTTEQAATLRALERAASLHTVARARVLAEVDAQGGHQDHGHGSTRNWLTLQARA